MLLLLAYDEEKAGDEGKVRNPRNGEGGFFCMFVEYGRSARNAEEMLMDRVA